MFFMMMMTTAMIMMTLPMMMMIMVMMARVMMFVLRLYTMRIGFFFDFRFVEYSCLARVSLRVPTVLGSVEGNSVRAGRCGKSVEDNELMATN